MNTTIKSPLPTIKARGKLIGKRLDLRSLGQARRVAVQALTLTTGEKGLAVLFRYGAVVLFDVPFEEESELLASLAPLVNEGVAIMETEDLEIRINPSIDEGFSGGVLQIHEPSIDRLQTVAEVMAQSMVIAEYEDSIATTFDRLEPLAEEMKSRGTTSWAAGKLRRDMGDTLLSLHRMVGRVEVGEKPEILWDHPELEPLYRRLEREFEIRERNLALERKLELISRTVETQLDLLQAKHSLRVEWYIVILIVVEILLTLYELFVRGGTDGIAR
jgi:required for meiotic nuclear division protein 1